MSRQLDARARDLARIHILKKDLALNEDQYTTMLHVVGGAESSKDLDAAGRQAVIKHMQAHVAKTKRGFPGRPHNTNAKARAELTKIEALLADAGKPWSYAEGIMRRVTYGRKQRLEFCEANELVAIIAALERNAIKRQHAECKATFGPEWHKHVAGHAHLLFDFDPFRCDVTRYTAVMSAVLRWWRGALQVACVWPVPHDAPAGSCSCCRRRAGMPG